ncbi:Uncharacterised protein [Mycobacterium tuberculosis]|uniref:Uncharacterized protein n=1 Tax=Mycobacterium tuberculosis TaxID=1773 RepID=A0A0T9DKV8_MYCTX|nr:Uncharacterised protein [Mycobacterium tuberculosis]CKS42236.1 Uncharacterised protein [Mycobacterium tuberculosis]CKS52747.1 Uncharacterised protein [Mycobacterium tuberculosis]CKS74220.1 Uncharacterised protein [Mycobacterium tuberculosis]COV47770.1 Uncharacterised protein [Mycobacterium tuberculosis]
MGDRTHGVGPALGYRRDETTQRVEYVEDVTGAALKFGYRLLHQPDGPTDLAKSIAILSYASLNQIEG